MKEQPEMILGKNGVGIINRRSSEDSINKNNGSN